MTATYPSRPFPAADPARLHAAARLHGTGGWDDARVRFLDIGCGSGGNALAVAARRPDALVYGIDVDEAAIAEASALAAEAGLPATFSAVDVRSAEVPEASWDVVLVHGVLSWVSEEVAAAALALAAWAVAPDGVVAVSYHALPGFRLGQIARDVVAGAGDAGVARERLAVAAELNVLGGAYGTVLAAEAERYGERDPRVLERDELVDVRPYSVRDLAAAARAAGLAYVGEAQPEQWWAWRMTPEAAGRLCEAAGSDRVEREQLADAALGAAFKLTLFARHAGGREPDAALRLYALPGNGSGGLSGAERRLLETAATARGARTVGELAAAAQMTAEAATRAALRLTTDGRLVLTAAAPHEGTPWPRPAIHPLARAQAARGLPLTTLLHTYVDVGDPLVGALLPLMDGTRDETDLGAELRRLGAEHDRPQDAARMAAGLDGHVVSLARLGLLE